MRTRYSVKIVIEERGKIPLRSRWKKSRINRHCDTIQRKFFWSFCQRSHSSSLAFSMVWPAADRTVNWVTRRQKHRFVCVFRHFQPTNGKRQWRQSHGIHAGRSDLLDLGNHLFLAGRLAHLRHQSNLSTNERRLFVFSSRHTSLLCLHLLHHQLDFEHRLADRLGSKIVRRKLKRLRQPIDVYSWRFQWAFGIIFLMFVTVAAPLLITQVLLTKQRQEYVRLNA